MFIQMHLIPVVVEIIGALVGFSLNGLIISMPSQMLLKNLYQ